MAVLPMSAMFAAIGNRPPWYRPIARLMWRRLYVRTCIKVAAIAVLREGAEEFVRLAFGLRDPNWPHGDMLNERKETN